MSKTDLTDGIVATGGVTVANVPLDGLLEPLQNVAVGVASVLILRLFSWIGSKLR